MQVASATMREMPTNDVPIFGPAALQRCWLAKSQETRLVLTAAKCDILTLISGLLLAFFVLIACSAGGGRNVRFTANGALNTDRHLSMKVTNLGFKNVIIHQRDYLFSVSCKTASGSEVLVPPDPQKEWPDIDPSKGTTIRPRETIILEMSFTGAKAAQIGCTPTKIEYEWP